MPNQDALRLAAEWLRQYDDKHDGGQDTARCADVAAWLDAQAAAMDLRQVAREYGVPVDRLRSTLQRLKRQRSGPEVAASGAEPAAAAQHRGA